MRPGGEEASIRKGFRLMAVHCTIRDPMGELGAVACPSRRLEARPFQGCDGTSHSRAGGRQASGSLIVGWGKL